MGCHVCGDTKGELRPYGASGQDICFPCMMGDPAREAEAEQQFAGRVAMAESQDPNGVAMVSDGTPPVPGSTFLPVATFDD